MQYAEMSLAHAMIGNEDKLQKILQEPAEAGNMKSSSVPYLIAMGRLLILQNQYDKAKGYLSRAVKEDVEVRNTLSSKQPYIILPLLIAISIAITIITTIYWTADRKTFLLPANVVVYCLSQSKFSI